MAGYLMIDIEITDREGFKDYLQLVDTTLYSPKAYSFALVLPT